MTNDQFGDGNIDVFIKDMEDLQGVHVMDISEITNSAPNKTGSLSLDIDLGRPFPEGGIIEIYGDEGSGKSTLALEALGQAVAAGKVGLYIDQERSLQRSLVQSVRTLKPHVEAAFSTDKETRAKCPVKLIRADSGEKALEAARRFARAFPRSIIVVDSVDALVPEAKLAEDIGTASMGSHAKLMSEALRLLVADVSNAKCTLIFINQKREKVGLVFGNPEVTGGGRGLKFYAWQRIELLKPSNAQKIVNAEKDSVGHKVRYKIIKNKMTPPSSDGEFPILYGRGIYRELEIVELCMKFGILVTGGKGGGQACVPIIKDGAVKEEKFMSKFNASRYMLLDPDTNAYLIKKLEEFTTSTGSKAELLDEIQNPEGA
jgi:recombination protein RecA